MNTQDPELSAALGWPGGISDPVLDRTLLLQMVAALRLASQQALEALEDLADCGAEAWSEQRPCVQIGREAITALRAALAQKEEPLNLSDSAVRKRLASQWGYVPAAAQAEPAQDQRCRAEPLSGGNFVCDCKIGECPGRSAEPAQEPVAWEDWWRSHGQYNFRATARMTFERAKELMKLAFEVGREAAPQPQQPEPAQEPVAWRFKPMIGSPWSLSDDGYYISCKRDKGYTVEPLYTAPPQRKPLTEEEIKTAFHAARNAKLGASQDNSRHRLSVIEIARAVEKASWEKNNGQA